MPDPRVERTRLHLLVDIIFITLAAVISGADSWNEIEEYGNTKKKWLKTILKLPNGIPSHDTFNRFFSALDPLVFEKAFLDWVSGIHSLSKGEVIGIDGKTVRGSRGKEPKSAIHMVSAWASENELVLGQIKVDRKSNEITAIPALLETLLIENCIVTIDAMGCQKDIASCIRGKKADYILSVKDNQKELHQNMQDAFRLEKPLERYEQIDCGHGRVETRVCSVITNLELIERQNRWCDLTTLIRLESERFIKASGITEKETRYFITSLSPDAEKIGNAIRSHWGIENKLHWTLDVAFREDYSRKREKNAAQNFSTILRIALNLIKQEKSTSRSMKGKRLKAGWDNDYLLRVLKI